MGKILPIVVLIVLLGMNILPVSCKTILDDTTPPETTHEFLGTMGDNNWFVSDVTIILMATDDKDVNETYISFDGINFEIYICPVVVEEDGIHELYYFSVDFAGNVEDVKGPFEFKIDQNPPDINGHISKIGNQEYMFEISLRDETSGPDKVEFFINNELMFTDYDEPYEWLYNDSFSDYFEVIGYDIAGLSIMWDTFPYYYGMFGIICNREIIDENISFFALIVRTQFPKGWRIFEQVTMPNFYDGYIGKFIINARWYNI